MKQDIYSNSRLSAVKSVGLGKITLMTLLLTLLCAVSALAQEATQVPISDTLVNVGFTEIFTSIASLVAFGMAATEAIKKKLQAKGFIVIVINWATSFILALVGYLLHVGIFIGASIWESLLYGFIASLASNGIFDISKLGLKSIRAIIK